MGLVNGRWWFSTPTVPRPLNRFSWNLKYVTNSLTRPRVQNFRGRRRRGWSGQTPSLTHGSFFLFLFCLIIIERIRLGWRKPKLQATLQMLRKFTQSHQSLKLREKSSVLGRRLKVDRELDMERPATGCSRFVQRQSGKRGRRHRTGST